MANNASLVVQTGHLGTIDGNESNRLSDDNNGVSFSDYTKALHAEGEEVSHAKPRPSQWVMPWSCTSMIIASLVLGLGVAIAHHLLYNAFNGAVALTETQQKLHFAGLALARTVSLLFTAAAAIAFRQLVWALLRRRALPIHAIDTLFHLDSNVLGLVVGWRTCRLAANAMLIATLLWAIQIPSFVTPGSVSTTTMNAAHTSEISVPSSRLCLFDHDISNADAVEFDYGYVNELLLGVNCYVFGSDTASVGLRRTIISISYSGQTPDFTSPCGSFNCTYELKYTAPTLKCKETPLQNLEPVIQGEARIPYLKNISQRALPTESFLLYKAHVVDAGQGPNYSQLFYNFTMTLLTGLDPIRYESYECRLFNTSMQYKFSFAGSEPSRITLARPPLYLNEITTKSNIPDVDFYRNSMGLYWDELIASFRGFLSGYFKSDTGSVYYGAGFDMDILSTSLVQDTSLRRYIYVGDDQRPSAGYLPSAPGNAGMAMEEISQNITVGLIQVTNYTVRANATMMMQKLVFDYRPRFLVYPYLLAFLVSLAISVLGLFALYNNGVFLNFKFSTIMRTTRNSALDSLVESTELGGSNLPSYIGRTKLKFGLVKVESSTSQHRPAFGTEEQVLRLQKGTYLE